MAHFFEIDEQNYYITEEKSPAFWTQLLEILDEIFINQDNVTLSLLLKYDNCRVAFLIRAADDQLISSLSAVFTGTAVYANFYVTRKEFRGSGWGMLLVEHFLAEMKTIKVPFFGKARASMLEKYMKGIVPAQPLWELFNVYPKTKSQLLGLFPPDNNNFSVKSIHSISPELFSSLLQFDRRVTGVQRDTFLGDFIKIVKGAIILDKEENVVGFAATRPCRHFPKKWQIAPLWAESEEAARALLEKITEELEDDVDFLLQCRKDTRGGFILQKAEETGIQTKMVASVVDFGKVASAPAYVEPINKNLMFVANGCAAHPDA